MEKVATTSFYTWICSKKNNKFVRKERRPKRYVYAYERIIPCDKVLKVLENYNLNVPKVLKSTVKYFDMEYINPTGIVDDDTLHEVIKDFFIELYQVDLSSFDKYNRFNTNTEYLYSLINYIVKKLNSFDESLLQIFKELNIDIKMITKYLLTHLDDKRKLTFIHGDLHKQNIINSDNKIYFVDWEMSTVGDLAYELANFFKDNNYSLDKERELVTYLCERLLVNEEGLLNDIDIYKNIILYRSVIMNIFYLYNGETIKSKEQLYNNYKHLLEINNSGSVSKTKFFNIINKKD